MNERLELLQPIAPFTTTQMFGENFACVDEKTGNSVVRRESGASCPNGFVSLYESVGMRGHNGIDLAAQTGQPIYAAHSGTVRELATEFERGIGISIISRRKHSFAEGTYYVKTRYWHLLAYAVAKGQQVQAGDTIGWADSTGLTSGTHLHFELKPCRRRWNYRFYNVFQGNGYFGAINPLPYFVEE